MNVTLIIGTAKGGFVCRADASRQSWQVDGPLFKGWKVTSATRNAQGHWLVATASDVYGCAIQKSTDLKTWKQVENGPAYEKESGHKLTQVWKLATRADGVIFAGVSEAGLFRSDDHGDTWKPVNGLNQHATRAAWMPGAGGLCAHSILFDKNNPERIWVGISAVGVFRSDDDGTTWKPRNQGIPIILEDKQHPDIGFCVHALAQDPDDPNRIYRQDHLGMFRSRDGAESWERNETGLASRFGFPIVMDENTRAVYAVPLESDEYRLPVDGKLRVFRSADEGDSWSALTAGLPQQHAYAGVLRGAMAVDNLSPAGVYFGTTSGDVYVSNNGGDSWNALPVRLPRVGYVGAFTE